MLPQYLLELVKKVAQEEGFKLERLEAKYDKYYISSTKNGHRCVDGRSVLETYEDESPTDYRNEDYKGDQFPGGTFGIIGALRVVAGLDEGKAREMVKNACDNHGIRMGDHIDDAHGKMKTREELEKRTMGCGNQDAIAKGDLAMYVGLALDRTMIDDRFAWLKSSGGTVPVLTGEHEENLAAINLEVSNTFNTSEAVKNNESIFNADLAAAYELAGLVFDELAAGGVEHQGPTERQNFQDALVKEVVRDYMQTLVALGGQKELYIRADPQVQV